MKKSICEMWGNIKQSDMYLFGDPKGGSRKTIDKIIAPKLLLK